VVIEAVYSVLVGSGVFEDTVMSVAIVGSLTIIEVDDDDVLVLNVVEEEM